MKKKERLREGGRREESNGKQGTIKDFQLRGGKEGAKLDIKGEEWIDDKKKKKRKVGRQGRRIRM